ncbi:MAG TPA: nuclear transport factor 2 family protein [Terrimicrobiaceae bacterium]|nr:nuclear transport factor 2 family protein [Terrimicrobiaceae bacterium]
MRARLSFAIGGLLAFLVLNAFGLSGDLAGNTEALEQANALRTKLEAGLQEQDPSALGTHFTTDAVWVTSHGVFSGRQAIEEGLASNFQRSPVTSQILQTNQLHSLGKEAAWSVGQWWMTIQSPDGPVSLSGYWSAIIVRESGSWKFRMLTLSESLRLALRPRS